ncbi:MAG TPA: hypothetical protein VFJ16_23835 [Longimicrobium sp.]|nr:hypothetical protein [Longimicrobium sp.]
MVERDDPWNVFSLASRLLGALDLSPGQLAQLRAIDHACQQRVFTLLRGGPAARGELTDEEEQELRSTVERDILAMLTPGQRERIGRA